MGHVMTFTGRLVFTSNRSLEIEVVVDAEDVVNGKYLRRDPLSFVSYFEEFIITFSTTHSTFLFSSFLSILIAIICFFYCYLFVAPITFGFLASCPISIAPSYHIYLFVYFPLTFYLFFHLLPHFLNFCVFLVTILCFSNS